MKIIQNKIEQNVFNQVRNSIFEKQYLFSPILFDLKSPLDGIVRLLYARIQWEHVNYSIYTFTRYRKP